MIYESQGVRTFRRSMRTIDLALTIHQALGTKATRRDGTSLVNWMYLADLVKMLAPVEGSPIPCPALYQATQRTMPFEIDGLVYSVESPTETRAYQKSKTVVARPGRLEDYAPVRDVPKGTMDARIEAKVAELAQWTNVFALREEARKYMDARLGAIEKRLSIVEKAIDISVET
jgi:hypothetical protein